ncbi:reverse transcriptase domain-containing protein [Trichonephila clavipes]|nr:reverse transcriptase domain-containing protein [Trichonephila clavipes]
MGRMTLPWLCDFFRDRTIRVKFNSSMVKGIKMSLGLPQRSVLSPPLLTLFMCGIEELEEHGIEGFRNSFPSDIVLFEDDLHPLSIRRKSILVKYYNKLLSYNPRNRTTKSLKNWSYNQRLKRNSPDSHVISDNMIFSSVERHHLSSCIDPSKGLPKVYFHPNLSAPVNKVSDPPEFLRQLALKVASNIPDAFLIYTDGSRNEHSRSGSGIYTLSPKTITVTLN